MAIVNLSFLNCNSADYVRLSLRQQLYLLLQQELSYRKQIARKLRTQYVGGIYRSNYP